MKRFDEAHHKCSLCGHQFQEEEGKKACRGCPLAIGCHMIKCPNCGYDMPAPPKFKALKSLWRKTNGANRKS